MATTTSRIVRLAFTTARGSTFSLTIPSPRQDFQLTETLEVMNLLIGSGIFVTTNGALTGIKDIKVIDTTTDDLYDPPQA